MNTVSICISVRDQGKLLDRTLKSILRQKHPYSLQIIVTDDGSTDSVREVANSHSVEYYYRENPFYSNGVIAKNNSLRCAIGDVVIQQSADVMHADPDCINRLVGELEPGCVNLATVQNFSVQECYVDSFQLAGPKNRRPLFFLGACWRSDICKVGGYDEEFAVKGAIWYDDNWHGDCLEKGLQLKIKYLNVLGLHQDHRRPSYEAQTKIAEEIYRRKCAEKNYFANPWPYKQGVSVNEIDSMAMLHLS